MLTPATYANAQVSKQVFAAENQRIHCYYAQHGYGYELAIYEFAIQTTTMQAEADDIPIKKDL